MCSRYIFSTLLHNKPLNLLKKRDPERDVRLVPVARHLQAATSGSEQMRCDLRIGSSCHVSLFPENSPLNRKWCSERTLLISEPALDNQPRLVAFLEGSLPPESLPGVTLRLRAANLSPFCDKLTTGGINVTHPLRSEFIETILKVAPIRFSSLEAATSEAVGHSSN